MNVRIDQRGKTDQDAESGKCASTPELTMKYLEGDKSRVWAERTQVSMDVWVH